MGKKIMDIGLSCCVIVFLFALPVLPVILTAILIPADTVLWLKITLFVIGGILYGLILFLEMIIIIKGYLQYIYEGW